ncbi:MAG: hydrogenase formation protein HypD [Elusimicrobiota bacterium]|jgi:hydrogenase expression/formation protein HypD|nr:hydrogenase formation protein HypD [Elusimicrobiota bacterium]
MKQTGKPLNIMEVCGTHTHAIAKSGLAQLLKDKVNFISGPGCPVCVSAQSDIDAMISLALKPDVITGTFGDMLRVPGTKISLQGAAAKGADIRIVYNPLDALALARANAGKKMIFLAVGFETTAPLIAACALEAARLKLKNFYIYCCLKTIPPALKIILDEKNDIDAFLLPGNVSVITGYKIFDFIARQYKKPAVVGGFNAAEIMKAVEILLNAQKPLVSSAYAWAGPRGNGAAQKIIASVFEPADGKWRGFGLIKKSALAFKKEFSRFDAAKAFDLKPAKEPHTKCRCALVLKGKIKPPQCPYFGRGCTPLKPLGPCMVSAEGACAACYNNAQR